MKIEYTRPHEPRIDRDLVAETTDLTTLRHWRAELEVLADDITAVIKANAVAGRTVTSAVAKLSFVGMAIGWIARRIKQLDPTPDAAELTYLDRLKAEVAKLHTQNDRLRQQVGAAREAREVQKLAIVVHAAGGFVRINPTHASEAFDLVLQLTEDKASGDVIYTTEVYSA